MIKNIIDYLLKKLKSMSTYLLAGSVVLSLITLIVYLNYADSSPSSEVIAFLVLGLVLPFAVAFSPVKLPYVAIYVFDLFACFFFLSSQASFIANVFTSIDGTMFPAEFFIVVIFPILAAVLSLVAMFFVKEPWDNKDGQSDKVAVQATAEGEQV